MGERRLPFGREKLPAAVATLAAALGLTACGHTYKVNPLDGIRVTATASSIPSASQPSPEVQTPSLKYPDLIKDIDHLVNFYPDLPRYASKNTRPSAKNKYINGVERNDVIGQFAGLVCNLQSKFAKLDEKSIKSTCEDGLYTTRLRLDYHSTTVIKTSSGKDGDCISVSLDTTPGGKPDVAFVLEDNQWVVKNYDNKGREMRVDKGKKAAPGVELPSSAFIAGLMDKNAINEAQDIFSSLQKALSSLKEGGSSVDR